MPSDATQYGLSLPDPDAFIHALQPDGSVVRGMKVLRLTYTAAGLGWVMSPSAIAPLE